MKINSIKDLKDCIIKTISRNMEGVAVADEFSGRQLYSKLEKPLIVVYLKSATQKGVTLGSDSYGFATDIVIGFTIFCSGTASPNDISANLAGLILFDGTPNMQSFTCQRAGYNHDFEVTEQNCEGNFSCIFTLPQAEKGIQNGTNQLHSSTR